MQLVSAHGLPLLLLASALALPLAAQSHSNVLTWTPGTGGDPAQTWQVWRSATVPVPTVGTPYAVIPNPATLTYTDTAVSAGSTWNYAVTGTNAGGEGPPSVNVVCVTPFFPPAAPGLSGVAK
jgi:hypothetical protein